MKHLKAFMREMFYAQLETVLSAFGRGEKYYDGRKLP